MDGVVTRFLWGGFMRGFLSDHFLVFFFLFFFLLFGIAAFAYCIEVALWLARLYPYLNIIIYQLNSLLQVFQLNT